MKKGGCTGTRNHCASNFGQRNVQANEAVHDAVTSWQKFTSFCIMHFKFFKASLCYFFLFSCFSSFLSFRFSFFRFQYPTSCIALEVSFLLFLFLTHDPRKGRARKENLLESPIKVDVGMCARKNKIHEWQIPTKFNNKIVRSPGEAMTISTAVNTWFSWDFITYTRLNYMTTITPVEWSKGLTYLIWES